MRTLKYLKGTYLDPLPGGLKEAESLHHEARRTKPNKTRKSQHSPIIGKIPIQSRSGQLLGRPRSNAMRLSPNFPRRGFGRGLRANGKAWRHVFWDSNLFLERRGDAPPWRHSLWPFALEPTNARTTSQRFANGVNVTGAKRCLSKTDFCHQSGRHWPDLDDTLGFESWSPGPHFGPIPGPRGAQKRPEKSQKLLGKFLVL